MKRLLIIMAKLPVPGEVKTRLQPFLTEDESAEFATALIRDVERKALDGNCDVVFSISPNSGAERLQTLLSNEHLIIKQKGGSLGERMLNAFADSISEHGGPALMIGTDCPMMPSDTIEEGFDLLERGNDVVIGPSEDGGYYLIGLKTVVGEMFEGVEWSSPSTLDQTVANMRKLGIEPALLPSSYDIDERSDLERLFKELSAKPEAAPFTARWLSGHHHLFST